MVKKKVCMQCGKVGTLKGNCNTVYKWYRLENIAVYHRTVNDGGDINAANTLWLDEEDDPDFCSLPCLMAWLKKRIAVI